MVDERIEAGQTVERLLLNEQGGDMLFRQQKGSTLRLFLFTWDEQTGQSAHTVTVEQEGENCLTEIYALSYLHGSMRHSLRTNVRHKVGKGVSNQIIRFVLTDTAVGEYAGEVILSPGAQQVDARQNNRNLLLSAGTTMRTRPCLEIYADDVKAAHGASLGQLDEQALFYMQQRGLSLGEAREMLVVSFMSECIAPLSDMAERERLMAALHSVIQQG